MNKLKVAVDIRGVVCFLEKFPDDEEHDGLHEMLENCHGEIDSDMKPGLYLATMEIGHTQQSWDGETEAYLDVVNLEPLEEQ